MGICDSLDKNTKNRINLQINDNLCYIYSKKNIEGTGFFCKIPFPDFLTFLPVLITSTKILDNEDIYYGAEILLRLKDNRCIGFIIDKNRKFYFNEEYQVTIIEIKNEDNLKIDSFLEVKFSQIQNEIYLIYYRNDNEHKPYYFGNILISNKNKFTHSCKYRGGELGCPIIDSSDYKVIGIDNGLERENGSNSGLYLEKPIKNFYDIYNINTELNIIFKDNTGFQIYYVKGEENMMFGELVVYFYIASGSVFDEYMSFFYNSNEILPYSTLTLKEMNIQQNSEIIFRRKNSIITNENINIIFLFDDSRKYVIHTNWNMTIKQLILKLCQNIKCPYEVIITKYTFIYNSETISIDNSKIKTTRFLNNSEIIIISKGLLK